MPLTPADVHSISFKKAPIGNRGYDEDEVDNFLDEVERELERLIDVNEQLRTRLEQGGPAAAGAQGVDNAELLAEFDRLKHEKHEAEKAAMALEQEIEQLRASGPAAPASAAAEGGEQQALNLLMTAQRTADEHLSNARGEAETVVTEARAQADELVTQARSQAELLEQESRKQHQEVMGDLEEKRGALAKHIEELKTFERQYRTRLKAYLESQLRDLTGRGDGVVEGGEVGEGQNELRAVNSATAIEAAVEVR